MSRQALHVPLTPRAAGKGSTRAIPDCEGSSRILPSRPHMAQRFPVGSVGPDGLHRGLASHRPRVSGPQGSVLQGDAWAVFSTQWPFGEEPLTGSSGAQSHYTPSGLFLPCSGWIAALSILKQDLAVSIIMMVVAGFFTLCAVLSLFLLKRVSGGCWASCKPKEAGTSLLPSPWGCSSLQQLGLLGPQRSSSFLQGSGWEVRQAGVCGGSLGNITWMTWFLVAHKAGLFSPQPLSAGALPVPPDGGQLPAGPRGVFPGHLQ